MNSRIKIGVFWSIFIIVFGIAPLAILEGSVRAYIYVKYGVQGKSYGLWRYDEVTGAQHKESSYNTNAETNNFGFRNKEDLIEPKPAGALRIITYGGSTTFCYNLTNDEAWPTRLEKRLRNMHHLQDQVLNGGAIMWSIGHLYARAKKDLPILRPEFVILYTGINETANAEYLRHQGKLIEELVQAERYGEFATNFDQNRWLKRNLALVRVYDYVVAPSIRKSVSPNVEQISGEQPRIDIHPDPAILRNYLIVLERFFSLIRTNGGEPIFVIQARVGGNPSEEKLTAYSRAGAALAKQSGVRVIDAQRVVESYKGNPKDLFEGSGIHFSKRGAELLAELISEEAFAKSGGRGTDRQPDRMIESAKPDSVMAK